jgi:death-on-curing protein
MTTCALALPEPVLVADLAAAYAFGLARNLPFVDGNKRISFIVAELFLSLNGYELAVDDAAAYETWMSLADGSLSEEQLAGWLRSNISTLHPGNISEPLRPR